VRVRAQGRSHLPREGGTIAATVIVGDDDAVVGMIGGPGLERGGSSACRGASGQYHLDRVNLRSPTKMRKKRKKKQYFQEFQRMKNNTEKGNKTTEIRYF
jgi:hypothetical protein